MAAEILLCEARIEEVVQMSPTPCPDFLFVVLIILTLAVLAEVARAQTKLELNVHTGQGVNGYDLPPR
jgi:hypothetical protein